MISYDHADAVKVIASMGDAMAGAAREFLAGGTAPAVAYGIVADAEVVLAGGEGEARIGASPPDSRSIFRIASMTKSFTAAAILQLRDAGSLRLDAAAADYVPELASLPLPRSDSRMPTVRDLLTMQGGWATDDPWADRQESMSPAEYTRMLQSGFAFNTTPGVDFEYSNLGYTILGRIIANVSGARYQDYVMQRIIRPLGMRNTGFALADIDGTLLADGHFKRDGVWQVEPTAATGEFAPLGGLFSTVQDLAGWVSFMCAAFDGELGAGANANTEQMDAVLASDSRREMQQGHRHIASNVGIDIAAGPLIMGSPMYGYGLMNAPSPRFGATVGHSGGYPGYGTHMVWHPVTGLGVIALSNGRYGGAFRLATRMLRDLLGKVGAPSRVVSPTPAAKTAFIHVNRLLIEWDDTAADMLFSPNVDEDEPRAHRVQAIGEQIAKVGGITGPAEDISSTAASHLAWWLPCASGRLRVEIRLAPQAQQKVQTLTVRPVPSPSQELIDNARELCDALISTGDVPAAMASTASGPDSVKKMAAVMRALETSVSIDPRPIAAESPASATFRIRGAATCYDLALALNDDCEVASMSLSMVAQTSDDNVLVRL